MSTSIEKFVGFTILLILVFWGGCGVVLYKATEDCQGLEGIIDSVWTGVSCAEANKEDTS